MPKRKISDLGPNECIHCNTEESAKFVCVHTDAVFKNWVDRGPYLFISDHGTFYFRPASYGEIYQRTDFVDEKDHTNYSRHNPQEEKKTSDETPVGHIDGNRVRNGKEWITLGETIRPGPFKTGDEVDGKKKRNIDGRYEKWSFMGYTTNGTFLLEFLGSVEEFVECRLHPKPLKRKQHTISCTDEVLEKVKQIEGVDFIS